MSYEKIEKEKQMRKMCEKMPAVPTGHDEVENYILEEIVTKGDEEHNYK